ncbi:MAG: hypothetical protein ABFD54_04185 [Armatimonadota bacterium]|nr:hypothetical protein [bacterium]
MRRHILPTIVILCLVVMLICLALSANATPLIKLEASQSGANNGGIDSIIFSWNIVYDTTCNGDYTLEVIGPQGTVVNKSYPCSASPISDSFVWTVPGGLKVGLYTAKLTFFSRSNVNDICCAVDFTNQAQVQFRICPAGTFRVCKFNDLNGNGYRDTGEPPLSDWEFTISGGLLKTPIVVKTGANGCTNVIAVPVNETGTINYQVKETSQSGWTQTTPAANPFTISLAMGGNADVVFGNWKPGKIKICKFEDKNGNGKQDTGEMGLANWDFIITGSLLQNPINIETGSGGCTELITVPVNSDGTATYQVEEVQQAGWTQTTPATNPTTVTVKSCETTNVLFGNLNGGKFKICKFQDNNGNGTEDPGEPRLPGWKFTVERPLGIVVAMGTTGTNGCTDMISVPLQGSSPLEFFIREEIPAGWVKTAPDGSTNPISKYISVGDNTDIVFGNWQPTEITGHKYLEDANPPLIPLSGIKMILETRDGTQLDTTTTDENGFYKFKPVGWRDCFAVREEVVDHPQLECDPYPMDQQESDHLALVHSYEPWSPTYILNRIESPWGVQDVNQPRLIMNKLTPVRALYDGNDFVNMCPVRLWGSICPEAPIIPNGLVTIENPQSGYMVKLPWCSDCGIFQAPPPDGDVMKPGRYVVTPPVLPNQNDYRWTASIHCGTPVKVDAATGAVTVDIGPCEDVRIDFCIEQQNKRQCYQPTTFTQEGWHTFCDPGNPIIPGGMIYNRFSKAFAQFSYYNQLYQNKMIVGKDKTITYDATASSLTRLCMFLPQTGSCGKLDHSYLTPYAPTPAGALAGETIALMMNIAYNDMRLMPRTPGYDLEKFTVASGPLKGRKVGEVLNIANAMLGGAAASNFGLPDCNTLVSVIRTINSNYEFVDYDTYNDRGYLIPNRMFGQPDTAHSPVVPFVP